MIFVGNRDDQLIDVDIRHVNAVCDVLKNGMAHLLTADELEDLENEAKFFEVIHLEYWNAQVFGAAYHLLTQPIGNDWFDVLIPLFKSTMESDPRFQAA